jgi:hypothetical protein
MVMIYMDFWSGRSLAATSSGRHQPGVVSGEVFELVIAGLEAGLARARVRNGYVPEDA